MPMNVMCQKATLIMILFFMGDTTSKAQLNCLAGTSPDRGGEEALFNNYVIEFTQQGLHLNTDVRCVPVVFHIINDPGFLLSRAMDQLERTNKHLRRTHPDTIHTRDQFVPFATDSDIELRLATMKPQGEAFNGLNHINVPGFDLSMTASVIAANLYDRTRYLNVWVLPGMLAASGVFPWMADDTYDGIMMGPQFVGHELGGDDPDMQGGKVFTHEVGHFLGLYHTFSGDLTGDPGNCVELSCTTMGDRCCDTPYDYRIFPIPGDVCQFDPLWCDQGEPVIANDENYMFYNLDHCQNMFSYDQRTRMRACLNNARSSLTTSETHASTGILCGTSVGVDEPVADDSAAIQIHPNPVDNVLEIHLPAGISITDLILMDNAGRVFFQPAGTSGITKIDVSQLPHGMYHIHMLAGGVPLHKRFVKE